MTNFDFRNCPVCSHDKSEVIYQQDFKNILGISMNVFSQKIAICRNCGMVFTNPFVSDCDLNNYYSNMSSYEYDDNNNEYPEVHQKRSFNQFNYILSHIDRNDLNLSVLDIGCALGYTLFLFKKMGYDVLGLEPSPKNKKIAKEKYGVEIETRFLNRDGLDGRLFDIIILSHVAEHLKYPLEIAKNIHNILAENGLLFIETPDIDFFDERDLYQFSFEHINYFNIDSLKNLFQQADFELLDSKIFYNDKSTAPFYPTLGTIWKKGKEKKPLLNHFETNKITINKYIKLINNFRNELGCKIENIISSNQRIALWAAGTLTSLLFSQTNLEKGNIRAIFDNDHKKHGQSMNGIPIFKPILTKDFFAKFEIDSIIIGSWSSQDEIYESIKFLELEGIKLYKLFD
ncbi:MAG: methyltransferase domain-containing protein [Candidatus Rifleibacteriota bacterium]